MAKSKIVIEKFPNPQFRNYHTSAQICETVIAHFQRPLDTRYLRKGKIGERGQELVKEVFSSKGVDQIYIKPYELSVEIGLAFDWEDIENDVISALKKFYGVDQPEIIGQNRKSTRLNSSHMSISYAVF